MDNSSICHSCGYETPQAIEHCPRCGTAILSKERVRHYGWVLLACGVFLIALMGTVIYFTGPMLLNPGVEINGARFTGTRRDINFIFGIYGLVTTFGVTATLYGLWQIKTGRRNKKVIAIIVALACLLLVIAALV